MSGQTKVDVYVSKEGEDAILRFRSDVLRKLPFPTQELRVPTSLGEAVVTVAGPETGPPLMLWQGANGPAPILLRGLESLVKVYRVYSADNPGQAGSLSSPALPDFNHHGLGRWAAEVMDGLAPQLKGKPLPLHMGISFGGATLMDLASIAPERIRAAVLWVPICLHPAYDDKLSTASLRLVWAVVLPWLLYRNFPCRLTKWWLQSALGDADTDPLVMEWSAISTRFVKIQDPNQPGSPPRFTQEQLAGLTAPVLVITGKYDVFGEGIGAAAQAGKVFKNVQVEVFAGKHMFGAKNLAAALQRALRFYSEVATAGGS